MTPYRYERCGPLVEGDGPDPASVGAAADGTGAIVTGPRKLMAQISGFALDAADTLTVRSLRTGTWGPAPYGFQRVRVQP